jgi:hypothetical protein
MTLTSTTSVFYFKKLPLALLAVLLLAWMPGSALGAYVGAETCTGSGCHDDQYSEWLTSGHRVILMESEFARHRSLPLPDSVSTWDEISHAIGGHSKKVLYLDNQGNIMDQQYNLLTGEWSQYDGGSTYDCGACHTTGYDEMGSAPLPGMVGSFELAGVQCEHCHGEGLAMQPGSKDAAFCGECHNHGPTDAVAASGGYIVAEGQYNEYAATKHSDHSLFDDGCVTCHNPHKAAEFSITRECGDCHSSKAASYASTLMASVGVECKDCHMAPATLSAQALGPNQGDTRTHLFRINTDPAASMFTPDGSQVALQDGIGAVTLDFACQRCHAGTSLETLASFAKEFHDASPGQRLAYVGLNPGLSGTWWGGLERDGEGFLMEFAYIGDTLIFFGSFYTFDPSGNQAWLTFQPVGGVPATGTSMDVDVYITTGPVWGDDFNPADKNTQPFGTGNFTFDSCTAGSLFIEPNQTYLDLGYSNLVYENLTRILEPGVDCPTFENSTELSVQAGQ